MSSAYQIYRSTTVGLALDDTLRELVHRQILLPRVVHYILDVFDQIINQKLTSQSVKGKKESCLLFKGHLLSYRACDQVWTLLFDSLTFTSNTDSLWKMTLNGQDNKIKIITCPATKLTLSNTEQIMTNEDDLKIRSKTCKKFKST
jgi:transcription initiation factor TFIIA small subunit